MCTVENSKEGGREEKSSPWEVAGREKKKKILRPSMVHLLLTYEKELGSIAEPTKPCKAYCGHAVKMDVLDIIEQK